MLKDKNCEVDKNEDFLPFRSVGFKSKLKLSRKNSLKATDAFEIQ